MGAVLEIIYALAATVAIVAGSGQVIRLIKVGRSEAMSISTWSLWFVTQLVSFAYTMTLKEYLLAVFNLMWLILYGVVFVLIIYYRRHPRVAVVDPVSLG